MKPLYQIANEYLSACEQLMELDEIPPEVINDTLSFISTDLQEKAINVAAFIKNLEAEVNAIKAVEKEMEKRRLRIEKKALSLREYLVINLSRCKIREINTSPLFSIKIKENPPTVIIDNQHDVPSDYKEIEITETINKAQIAKILKNGEQVPGAHLEQKLSVSIK